MSTSGENTITVYEHESITTKGRYAGKLTDDQLKTLQGFNGEAGVPYFTLINNGLKFCEFVGVLQVGKLTIEVLPKVDRGNDSDKDKWRTILIDMLKKVGTFEVSSSSETNLKIKRNSILDLYTESFLVQAEKLLHRGLIKKYRKVETNSTALKGKLVFPKHIAKNIIHKERFFVKYTVYDHTHTLNKLLYKTLNLIRSINTNPLLQSKVCALLLSFSEMPDIKASESLFTNMVFDRKSEPYRQAMLISRLLLLNYHPDINSGRNHVLALMFDMNLLWEKFVYVSLKKYLKDGKVEQQFSKPYWKLSGKRMVNLRPDVIINKGEKRYVLDTKWKLPGNNKPGHSDLQQMYAYTKYFESSHTILCYPGPEQHLTEGYYCNEIGGKQTYPCSVLRIGLEVGHDQNIVKWQKDISDSLASVCK